MKQTTIGANRDSDEVVTARLVEAERLFRDFRDLTPYGFTPFVRTFDSFADYERWRNAQDNPWYR